MTGEAGPRSPAAGRRRLVEVSAALASGEARRVEAAMDRASEAVEAGDLEQREVEEALLQTCLFLGYPAAFSALASWRDRMPEAPEETDPLARPRELSGREERGEEVCRRVYGRAYAQLRRRVRELHPALDRWMVTEGYGKVLGRPGLDLVDRELCVAALLAVRGRGPQLHSHLRGALRAGADAGTVEAALELALEAAEGPERRAARRVWTRVRRRAREAAGGEGTGGGGGEEGGPGTPGL